MCRPQAFFILLTSLLHVGYFQAVYISPVNSIVLLFGILSVESQENIGSLIFKIYIYVFNYCLHSQYIVSASCMQAVGVPRLK